MQKGLLSFVLVLALVFGCFSLAFAADTGTIDGGNDVLNPVYMVALPANLSFTINQYEIGTGNVVGNQILTTDYKMANFSEFDVEVAFDMAASTTDAAFVSNAGLIKNDTTKNLYFGMMSADGVTGVTATTTSAVDATFSYSAVGAAANTFVALTPTEAGIKAEGKIAFALAEASVSGSSLAATSDAGIAAFQFFAKLDKHADWKAGDLAVKGNYTLTPMSKADYAAVNTIGLNMLAGGGGGGSSLGFDTGTTKTINVSKASMATTTVTIPFNAGGGTPVITWGSGSANGTAMPATNMSYAGGTITVHSAYLTSLKGWPVATYVTNIDVGGVTYKLNYVLGT